MNLDGLSVKRISRAENCKGLIKCHIERINSTNYSHLITESDYWIGVAYNDYFNDKNKVKSAMVIHDPDH